MSKKALKIAVMIVAALLLALTAGVVTASTKSKAELPEYVGSQACLGCHTEQYLKWEPSGHAHMVDQIMKPSDYPADVNAAPEALKAELQKADYLVAGHRFLARDPQTGELKYLNVQYDDASKSYVAYKGGSSWDKGCAGCHSTGWDISTARNAEMGIGCESCHGPARDHILGKGDVAKITVSTDSATCGQCHNGSGKNANGVTWPVGYRPGMGNLDSVGFAYAKVPDDGKVPVYGQPKMRQYAMWEASAHATATKTLEGYAYKQDRCYECHSGEARILIEEGKGYSSKDHKVYDGVSCVACHDPHNSNNVAQLRQEPKALCESCHSAEIAVGATVKPGSAVHHPMKEMLAGYGAIGVANTTGAHTGISCVECHMTEGNHLMQVIKPEDVVGTTRTDSCTACHANSTPESRAVYLSLWHESIETRLEAVKGDVAVIDAVVKANPNLLSGDLKATYDAAKTNYTFVDADASKGAHNFEYAIKIISKAQKDIASVRKALGR